jgi:O-antigen/teichoic acid export membrane protein
VEFGKHLGKGLWGIADKALPVVYGLGYVLLVIRVLPEVEFGNFVLVQELFLIISMLAMAFALQPLLKFASEDVEDTREVTSAAFALHAVFLAVASLTLLLLQHPLAHLFNAPGLASLIPYVPAMLGASLMRNFTLTVLQARFMLREVFWTDAAHFLGAPLLVWIVSKMALFDTALDLVIINIVSLATSSLVGIVLARRVMAMPVIPRPDELRRVVDYGRYATGGLLSYLVYAKADTFILSAFTGPVQVAVYNSVKVFTRIYEMLPQVVQMIVLPASSRLSSRQDETGLQALVEKSILFLTVSMVPVFLVFFLGASPLLEILYQGRYGEAAPILQVFSVLALAVPMITVGSNVLLGLGKARMSFLLSLQMLGAALAGYFGLIPWLGGLGAAIGLATASILLVWSTLRQLQRVMPLSLGGILRRVYDITRFLRVRIARRYPR